MEAIEKADPGFVEWVLARLAEAEKVATRFELKDIDEEEQHAREGRRG